MGKEINLEQGSEDWLRWRRLGIGASEAAIIKMEKDFPFGDTVFDLWERKLGLSEKVFSDYQHVAMDRGTELEPEARRLFIEQTGLLVEPVCIEHEHYAFLRASMDGMTLNRTVGVEIKAPGIETYNRILKEGIPAYYYAQVQHQFAVTNARTIYFWAYHPEGDPPTFLLPIKPDEPYIEDLLNKEIRFWKSVRTRIPPVDSTSAMREFGALGLVMISGYTGAGKKTSARQLANVFDAGVYSFSSAVRETANDLGLLLSKVEKKNHERFIQVGNVMRKVYPDIWIKGLFNVNSDIYQAMRSTGAIITGTRYVNEMEFAEHEATRLGMPFRLIWIERPGVGALAGSAEPDATRHLKNIADCIVYNDSTVKALSSALVQALTTSEKEVKANDFV